MPRVQLRFIAGALLSLPLAGCVSGPAGYERSLEQFLRDPVGQREQRSRLLGDLVASGDDRAGWRLAYVHHALRADSPVDADALLTAEARAFPAAAGFLAAYRRLMRIAAPGPPLPAAAAADGLPRVLLVVPVATGGDTAPASAALAATIEAPLRELGVYPIPADVGRELLELAGGPLRALAAGAVDDAALRALREELAIEGCLVVQVARWRALGGMFVDEVEFVVRYGLWDAATGAETWRDVAEATYRREDPAVTFDRDAGDPFFWPSSYGSTYRDDLEFARALNRSVDRKSVV